MVFIQYIGPTPQYEKHAQTITLEPPCFMVLEVNFGLYSTLGGRLTYERDPFPPYSTILLSSVHKIFLHLLNGQFCKFHTIFSQSIANCFNTCFYLKLLFQHCIAGLNGSFLLSRTLPISWTWLVFFHDFRFFYVYKSVLNHFI